MTARDTIAHAIHLTDPGHEAVDNVIAAIRAMPVEDQAELIGGGVETSAWKHWPEGGTRRRVRGPWTA